MARGISGFDGAALRKTRLKTPDPDRPGRTLTAERLAQMTRTSKAQILSYENGRSSPSPRRLVQLADVLGVPATQLRTARVQQLSDLRIAQGLTIEALAERLKIAVNTYKRIERVGIFPKRHPATEWRLASYLRIEHEVLLEALGQCPAVRQRREIISAVLAPLVKAALAPGPLGQLQLRTPECVQIAELLQAPSRPISRLVNRELLALRRLATDRATTLMKVAYSPYRPEASTRRVSRGRLGLLGEQITHTQQRLPELLERYLLNPLPWACWSALTELHSSGPTGLPVTALNADVLDTLDTVFGKYLLNRSLMSVSLSPRGVMFVEDVEPYYQVIYGRNQVRDMRQTDLWDRTALPSRNLRLLRRAHILGHDPRPYLSETRSTIRPRQAERTSH